VLLGRQGDWRITAEELGARSGTINYEITTGIDPRRVERSYADVRGS
jgi:alanine racemase